MSGTVLALPVSVEQIAAAIKQMKPEDQQRLLDLAPDLRRIAANPPSRTTEQAQATVARVQADVLAAVEGRPLSPDEPFLGDLTLGQYQALPDEEKARLWETWAGADWTALKEREVNPDALLAG